MAPQALVAPRAAPVRKRGTTHRPQGIPAPSRSRLGKVEDQGWDGEPVAIREFRGDFSLMEQKDANVGFGSE
jgi:hypothetical protein